MEVKRLQTLGLEIFKTLNNLNPASIEKLNSAFINEIFRRMKWLTHRTNNIQVNVHNIAKYGGKVWEP